MSLPKNIILTGFMGTGKTTVGRILSEKLGWPAVDTDDLIESREGKSIPDIFTDVGEEKFREIETAILRELADGEQRVVTLGGGAVTRAENLEILNRCGLFICLNASPETILERIESEGHRPLLEGGDKLERIREILSLRQKIYASIPCQVDTEGKTPEQIADEISALIQG